MANKWKKVAAIAVSLAMASSIAVGMTGCKDGPKATPPKTDFETTAKEDKYTVNSFYSTNFSTWNPHTWETNDDSLILGYIGMGFYDVQLNEDGDGYEWVTEMASKFPVDVTSKYVGQYGVKKGETKKVWEITLNENACWDDGTGITADDYIYSMQQQLNPDMLNRRSDSYTGGNFTVVGARNYLYSHSDVIHLSIAEAGYETNAEAIAAGANVQLDVYNSWGMEGAELVEGEGACPKWLSIDDETLYLDPAYYSDLEEGKCTEEDIEDYYCSGKDIYEMLLAYGYGAYIEVGGDYQDWISIPRENTNKDENFAHVGIKKTDTYKIVIALQDSISEFDLKTNLTSNWLVKKDVYEACKVPSTEGGLTISTYCTTKDSTPSYGPYSLTTYTLDTEFKLTYNPYWYGYSDGAHEGQFQCTSLNYRYLAPGNAHETAMEMMMLGQIDEVDLTTDMEYSKWNAASTYVVTPESYTMQLFITTNEQYLEQESESKGANHKVLALQSFRKAISYAINRQAYCAAYYPASQPGFGILNYMYSTDPETGVLYRDSDEAKKVSLKYAEFTENQDGSWTSRTGTNFETLDEAYEAITGYDPNYAAVLFEQAYDEAIAAGIYTPGENVRIEMRSAGTSASTMFTGTVAMFNKDIADALALCNSEKKFTSVEFEVGTSASQDEYKAAQKAGQMDVSYSGWGGAIFDPFGTIFSSYIDPTNSNNYGFDKLSKTIPLSIEYKGETINASLYNWAAWLDNHQTDDTYDMATKTLAGVEGTIVNNLCTKLGKFVDAEIDLKIKVLAACELAQLNTTLNIPLYYQSVGSIMSGKYSNGVDVYLPMIGFGGIRHATFNYTNAEWTAFVAGKGGNIESWLLNQ